MPVSSRRDFLKTTGALALGTLLHGMVQADELIRLSRAELINRNDAYLLTGGYDIHLTPALDEALQKGVTLGFTQIFEADRPRDFWFAEDITVVRRLIKLSYNSLLRHYQLNVSGNAGQVFETRAQAEAALGDFAEWPVLERRQLSRKYLYRARVRMYLDTSQLPKPLQINAVASSRWDMDSGWAEWTFRP